MIKVKTPPCPLCKRHGILELTEEECGRLDDGLLIQDALPERSPEFREQIMTGTHGTCWSKIFGGEN